MPRPPSLARLASITLTLMLAAPALHAAPPDRLWHGAAYYPELWPETEITRDIAEMKRVGINLVRIGEFAWSKMEPDEGRIDLSFFRRVMDRMHEAGIAVVLCTPTATPPVWLTHGHPDRLFVDESGTPLIHGARQHVSTDHPAMRAATARIVEAMARELGHHPALVAWQIDNEFKCHVREDFNPAAIARWHSYLEKRYKTIDALNEAWGADIWSQRYQRFDQVPAPLKTPFLHNASLSTAYRLFTRESVAEYMEEQNAVIRRHSRAPITHNSNVGFGVNHERMTRDLDFASFDDYPSQPAWRHFVFQSDVYRAAIPGRPFWVMETSPSHNGWLGNNRETNHPVGFLRVEAVAAYALGGEAFNYWLWRQQRTGCELPHGAVIHSWGTPSVGWPEVEKVEAARRELEPLFTRSEPAPAEVAVTWSDRGRAMLETEALGATGHGDFRVGFHQLVTEWHYRLLDLGYPRDVRFEGASLDGLKLLITPAMPAVDESFLTRVRAWVEAGGVWIVAPITGTRTVEHTAQTEAGLGGVEALAGVETVYGFPVNRTGARGTAFHLRADLGGWCMALRPVDATTRVVGKIEGGAADGLAWITERPVGRGLVVVIGAEALDEKGSTPVLDRLVEHYAERAGLARLVEHPPGLLVAPRVQRDGRRLLVLLNMEGRPVEATLKVAATDALADNAAVPAGPVSLEPYSYRVLTLP